MKEIMLGLINNITLLFTLLVIHSRVPVDSESRVNEVFQGLVIGAIGLGVMFNHITISSGIIIDSRTALLVTVAFFFEPITAMIAAGMMAIYRIILGGDGIYAGVAAIITSTCIGIVARRIFYNDINQGKKKSVLRLYLIGLFTNFTYLLFIFMMPQEQWRLIVRQSFVSVILIFPLVTMIVGTFFMDQIYKRNRESELKWSNEKLTVAFKEIQRNNEQIIELAKRDSLTKLYNRYTITNMIDGELKSRSQEDKYVLFFLDLDNFKLINDTYGHYVGDSVLIEVAHRLQKIKDSNTIFGRFGGDEFLIIKKLSSDDELSWFTMNIEGLFIDPIELDNRMFYMTASIGAVVVPDHGTQIENLVKKADLAMYVSKKAGKNRCSFYKDFMGISVEDKLAFQSQVRTAFYRSEFYLEYQPFYDLHENCYTGVEALLRWNSDARGQVSPLKIVEAAEEMGLIVDIGRWIIEEAVAFSKVLNKEVGQKRIVTINISPTQLLYVGFMKDVSDVLQKYDVAPDTVYFEMTETTLFQYSDRGLAVLDELQQMGIGIALDDFGTGYSSLSYFRDLPSSILKIDKGFIDHIGTGEFDRFMLESIIKLGHKKGLKIIAEGVEERAQMDILHSMNCDYIQGYYCSKPLSEEDVLRKL